MIQDLDALAASMTTKYNKIWDDYLQYQLTDQIHNAIQEISANVHDDIEKQLESGTTKFNCIANEAMELMDSNTKDSIEDL